MTTWLVTHPSCAEHDTGPDHPESPERLRAVLAALEAPQFEYLLRHEAPRASLEQLCRVHERAYVDRLLEQIPSHGHRKLDADTVVSPASGEAGLHAAGAVISAVDAVLGGQAKRAFCAVRPPGHHAEAGQAMGFCLFNNIALGARYLQEAYGVKKIMIVDIDAHHGNGTQTAFYTSSSVLYFSMHQFPCYPGTGNFGETGSGPGEGYSVNVPLPKGLGDREFVQVLHFIVRPLAYAFEPEILLISCGFDLYQHDRLAGMQATPEGYGMITRLLLQLADAVCGGKIAFIMEGGYSIQGIRECGRMVIKEMCALSDLKEDRLNDLIYVDPSELSFLRKSMEVHKKYWKTLL